MGSGYVGAGNWPSARAVLTTVPSIQPQTFLLSALFVRFFWSQNDKNNYYREEKPESLYLCLAALLSRDASTIKQQASLLFQGLPKVKESSCHDADGRSQNNAHDTWWYECSNFHD